MSAAMRNARQRLASATMIALLAASAATADSDGVGDGIAISHEFASTLFARMAPLREADGCILSRFDTSRFRIVAGLTTPSGAEAGFEFATDSSWRGGHRRAGAWQLAVAAELDRDCPQTVAAVERILRDTPPPHGMVGRVAVVKLEHILLSGSVILLLLGTALVLVRETRAVRPPPAAVAALFALSAVGLALRLTLSPRTFLHEYYHIAETINAYLSGNNPPTYGNTGPVIYRLVGMLLGRPDDVDVIFFTNAVIAALAVPAVALLDLAIFGRWARALAAALLLCLLPHHLRFSASEVLFIPAVTLSLWSLALAMLYLRRGALGDALLCAIAVSLAMQSRPEMMPFPALVAAFAFLLEPRRARALAFDWRSLGALALLAALVAPRIVQLAGVIGGGNAPPPHFSGWIHYLECLTLLDAQVTPRAILILIAAGAYVTGRLRPGLVAWCGLAYAVLTLFPLSLFSTGPYNLRAQILPNSLLLLLAAGMLPLHAPRHGWARLAHAAAILLFAAGASGVATHRGFITELRDQQLEWQFLRQHVPALPPAGRLLAAVEFGGRNLNAFPDYLLRRNDKSYRAIEVRKAAAGEIDWPEPGDDLIFYHGMYCYFAFDYEPAPVPMTATCSAVHRHYQLEPLRVATLDTSGYSWMQYAPPPYRIGFYRLRSRRDDAGG